MSHHRAVADGFGPFGRFGRLTRRVLRLAYISMAISVSGCGFPLVY